MALSPRESHARRAQRTRTRLKALSNGRPRLSVFRSSKNIYAQIIDDERGVTLASASSLESEKVTKGADNGKGGKGVWLCVCGCVCVWLCVDVWAVVGCVWLCVAVCGCVWLCVAVG